MIYIGFTGTQDGMSEAQQATVTKLLTEYGEVHPAFVFRHGDCIGSDAQAHDIARAAGAKIVLHPPLQAEKRAHCKGDDEKAPLDYLERNKEIVKGSTVLIATPKKATEEKRSGTWATIRDARKRGIKVQLVQPDGVIAS